jgi:hypothetical protein
MAADLRLLTSEKSGAGKNRLFDKEANHEGKKLTT